MPSLRFGFSAHLIINIIMLLEHIIYVYFNKVLRCYIDKSCASDSDESGKHFDYSWNVMELTNLDNKLDSWCLSSLKFKQSIIIQHSKCDYSEPRIFTLNLRMCVCGSSLMPSICYITILADFKQSSRDKCHLLSIIIGWFK